jgi:hypothetical protein
MQDKLTRFAALLSVHVYPSHRILQVCGRDLDVASNKAVSAKERFDARTRIAEELTQRLLTTKHTIGRASRKPVIRTYLCYGVSDNHTLLTGWPNDAAGCVDL